MVKLIITSIMLLFAISPKEKKYIIMAGDITCKACVIQIHQYLSGRTKTGKLLIGLRNKGNLILNESSVNYYRNELPKSSFIFFDGEVLFPRKERYPYVLRIDNSDTLKIPYDSLFSGKNSQDLQLRHLR